MSSSVPSGPSDPNEQTSLAPTDSRRPRPVESEEWWAVVLAILTMAGIFWWTIGRDRFSVDGALSSVTGNSSAEVTGGAQGVGNANGNGAGSGNLNGAAGIGAGLGVANGAVNGAGGESSDGDGGGGTQGLGNASEVGNGADGDSAKANGFGGDRPQPASETNRGLGGLNGGNSGSSGASNGGDTYVGDAAAGNENGGAVPPPPAEGAPSNPDAVPLPAAPAPQAFDDVPDSHWAAPFVNQVSKLGYIEGFPDNTFRPDEPVNRAQLAAVVSQAYSDRPPTVAAPQFSDLASDFWGTEAVLSTVRTEFMKGYPDGTFNPERPIPRLEAVLTFVAGLKLKPQGNPDEVLGQFSDGDQVPDWAKSAITAAIENRLLANPKGKTLDLKTTATRADIASMVYQALNSENKVGAVDSPHILSGE
ncbi:MAG: S-layer homology domain-containing protein [Cyanobacteria bacterium P01_D01_bin.73]